MKKVIQRLVIIMMFMSSHLLNGQINCGYTLDDIYCLDYVQDFFDGVVAYTFSSTDYQDLRIHNATNDNGEQFIYLMIFTQTNQFSFGELWEVYDCSGNLIERCESVGLAITCEIGDPETPRNEIIYSANANGESSFPACANCEDEIQNGQETGIDCGGPDCPPCASGCTDPEANNYDAMAAQDDGSCAYCCDGIQNGTETGVDCGGPVCAPCNYTLTCDVAVNSFSVTSIPFTIDINALIGVDGACNISFDRETSTRTYEIDCSDFGTQSTKLDSLLLYDTVTEDSCYVKYNIAKASNLCTCGQDDYQALLDLYHATDGDNWRFNAGWVTGALGNSCVPCDWYGIVCNNDNRVIAINLDTNFMEGIIPSTISQVDDLVLLDLKGNALSGSIPTSIEQLDDLEFLVLNNNQIGGSIPQFLGSMTKLKRIVLFNNIIEGQIPTNLTNLDDLEWLMLSNNNLTGSIPSNLNQLDNLTVLWLSTNGLSGSIPSEITGMDNLINLLLQENNLTGEIPANIGFLNNMEKLLLNDNNLEGCFPSSLDNLCGIGESQEPADDGYNFSGNNLLPFNGDYERICNGEDQIDAFCGSLQDSLIDVNCMCVASPPSVTCSVDTDEILCYDWLNAILANPGICNDPGPSAYVFKVYTTNHNGSPAIFIDYNRNCIDPSVLGADFFLYTCEGDEIASCAYGGGFPNCDNPPNGDPILGPAFDNATLIYNSEVDVLPDCTTQRPFITTWNTATVSSGSSGSTSITIPTTGAGYSYDVDWENDGVYDEFNVTGNITHDYGVAGVYEVAIQGDFPRIFFNNEGDNDKILNIDQWGGIEWTSMERSFYGCRNLVDCGPDAPNLSAVNDLSIMFGECYMFNGKLNIWDVSSVTNMRGMFSDAESFNQPLEGWDVSSVTDMSGMFQDTEMFNQPIESWDVSSVTDMRSMFNDCNSFDQPLEGWDVSSVTDMNGMFLGCGSFDQPLEGWDVSSVTDMNGMFRGCGSFDQPLEGWDVSSVTDMGFMFQETELFNQSLEGWDVSSVTDMGSMFQSNDMFNQSLEEWDVFSVTDMGAMFRGAISFNKSLGKWDLHPDVDFVSSISFGIFQNSGLDCENYSKTLIGWANNTTTPTNRDLGPLTGMQYGTGEAEIARNYLRDVLSWTIDGDTQGTCSVSTTCSMDTDTILCYDWLIDIISTSFCTDPGPTVYKVYTTSYDGNPAILVDSYTNCNNPSTLGGGFTLYTCEGLEIANCTYAGFNDCNNPPDDHPILGPAFDNGALIYNSEVDVLSDCSFDCTQNSPVVFINFPNGNTSDEGEIIVIEVIITQANNPPVDFSVSGFSDDIVRLNVVNSTTIIEVVNQSPGTYSLQIEVIDSEGCINDNVNVEFEYIVNPQIPSATFRVENGEVEQGQLLEVDIVSESFVNLTSFQFGVTWDSLVYSLNDVINLTDSLDFSTAINLQFLDNGSSKDGSVLSSWTNIDEAVTLSPNEVLFTLVLEAVGEVCDSTEVEFDAVEASDFNFLAVSPITFDGTLSISGTDCSTAQRPFITTWKTDNPGSFCTTCITIPTEGSGYNYDVDWDNDGVYDDVGLSGDITYDFGSSGTYTIAIRGDFPRIYFNNEGDRSKITEINQWGDIEWISMEDAFNGCDNLILNAPDVPNLVNVTNMNRAFASAAILNQDMSNWDVSNVTLMNNTFILCSLFNQDLSSWDVSNVTDMSAMFAGASSFNQNISTWDLGNVTNLSLMFWEATSFNQDISSWNVSNVTNMVGMFTEASNFNQDISNWVVSNVIDMGAMFSLASNFNGDISNWNTDKVEVFSNMFNEATSFNHSLASWDLSAVINMENMFNDSAMDCENYSSTLIGWEANSNTPDNIALGALNIEFGANAIPARDQLITRGWTFNGDTQGSCGIPCPDDEVFNSITICTDSLSTIILDDFASQNPNGDDVSGWLGSVNLIFGENTFVVDVSPNCSYIQSVTIVEDTAENCTDPCPDIVWTNVPDDITINYSDLSTIQYELSYDNGGMDVCQFDGTIVADTTITDDGCDKRILLEWSATENQITIDTNQTITITNIPAPAWIDPPMDVEILCDDIPSVEDRLQYSNGLLDFCEISGVVEATIDIDTSICSEDRILTWNFDGGVCFSDLIHSQEITVIGCNDFSLNDDYLSAMTKEDISFNLLDNDIDLIPNVDYAISITNLESDLLQDTMLTQDGLFSFRLADSFFDTIKVTYQLCDLDCNICEEATFFITDEIFEDIIPTNYLSPNGDGQNDQLRFTREEVMDDTELWIFNRWGDQLYHKENYTNDWDAAGIPSGVYYYVLRVRDVEIKRTLTILK